MKIDRSKDIAIIGMSALFPKAPDLNTYWDNLLNRVDAITDPMPGWGHEISMDPGSDHINRVYTKRGGFLGGLGDFDPARFGIMPNSVPGGEPDQFIALNLAADALEDAGYGNGNFNSQNTGIILGHAIHANRANTNGIQIGLVLDQTLMILESLFPGMPQDVKEGFSDLFKSKLPSLNPDSVPGLVPNMMTGRIANRLNLMGPNYILDGACSSSLIAIDSAIMELIRGRADMMLAGGINTTSSILVYMVFCQMGALSRSSRIRPFDTGADGTLLGEGAGIVVLKRYEDALRDNDRVYAVIKGVGISSDGRAKGMMAPRLEGEVLAMERAYKEADLSPESVELMEAHGTGIPLGDRTEIQALKAVMGERKGPFPTCALGSVKSMIGHCIPAAGIASVIKCSLALYHKLLPPMICNEVDKSLGIEETSFYVNTELRPWIHTGQTPRRAGINAFGFGGINSHMILEETGNGDADFYSGYITPGSNRNQRASELFLFAEKDRESLVSKLTKFQELLKNDSEPGLREHSRKQYDQMNEGTVRAAVSVKDRKDLEKKISKLIKKIGDPSIHSIQSRKGAFFTDEPLEGKIAFLFPGEGSQYENMLGDLALEFHIVRKWFDFLEGLFTEEREISPAITIFPPPTCITEDERKELAERLLAMDSGSEAVFAADQAIYSLLSRLGIHPYAMAGHSTGENAALVASGIMHDTSKGIQGAGVVGDYIRLMNKVFQKMETSGDIPEGVLLTVGGIDQNIVNNVVDEDSSLRFTMDNCPDQMIIFGPEEAVRLANDKLKKEGGICTRLPFGRAYHTEYMLPMAEEFANLFSGLRIRKQNCILYSCATMAPFPKTKKALYETIRKQYVTRVHFSETINRMHDDGIRFFVESGPSSHLTAFVRSILRDKPHVAVAANDRKKPGIQQLHLLLGQLFIHGVDMDLDYLFRGNQAEEDMNSARETKEKGNSHKCGMPLPSNLPMVFFEKDEIRQVRGVGKIFSFEEQKEKKAEKTEHEESHGRHGTGRGRDGIRRREIGGKFKLDFDAAVYLVELGTNNKAISSGSINMLKKKLNHIAGNYLNPKEMEGIKKITHPTRMVEWLLGRIACKEAVLAWFKMGFRDIPGRKDIQLDHNEKGKPEMIYLRGQTSEKLPSVSLSHTAGKAISIAAPSDVRIGIDMESAGRIIKDLGRFKETAFTEHERSQWLSSNNGMNNILRMWSIKEACAKAIGIGLVAYPRSFKIRDTGNGLASVLVESDQGDICARSLKIGSFFLAVGWAGK